MSAGDLVVSIIGDMSKLSSVFRQASAEVGNFGSSVTGKVGKALSTVGTAAVVAGSALGVGLVASGAKATSMFVDFEKSVSNAASVTGLVGEAFDSAKANISAVAQELGQKTAFSSSQAADALYNLASAGVDVSKITASQMVPVLNLASATQYDLAETTGVVTSALSQFGLGFDSAARVSDVFASASGLSQANMEKLGYSMAQVGTTANSLGISLEDTTGALSTLYNAGMDGSAAGTALKGILASLASPTKAATTALEMYGIKIEDVNPATHKFSDIVQTLADHGLNAAGAVDIFGREGMSAIMALTSKTGELKTLTGELANAGGTAQTMADQQLDTLSGSLDALSGSIENLMINVGQALAPTIRQMADSFNAMIPSIQDWVVAIVTGFVSFVSQLGGSVSAVQNIGSTIIEVFSNIFKSISGGSIGSSAADVINGIMKRIAGIVMEFAPVVQNGIISVINIFRWLIDALQPVWNTIKSMFETGRQIFSDFVNNLGPTWENIGLIFDSVQRILSGVVESISPLFSSLSDTINNSSIGKTVADTLNSITTAIADFTMSVAENGLVDTIEQMFNFDIPDLNIDFSGIFKSVMDTLKEIDFTGIWNSLVSAFSTGNEVITGLIEDLSPTWDNLKSSFDSVKKLIEEIAPDIAKLFTSLGGEAASSSGSVLVDVINGISGAIAGLLKWLADNPKIVEFGLALAGVAVAAGGLIIGLAGVITALTPLWTTVVTLTGVLGAEGLGAALSALFTTLFPGLAAAIGTVAGVALPALSAAFGIVSTVIGTIVYTVIPILVEGLGLLLTPVGLVAGAAALLAVAWSQNWFNIQGVAQTIWNSITTGLSNFYSQLQTAYNNIVAQAGTLKTQFGAAWQSLVDLYNSIKAALQAAVSNLYTSLQNIYNQIVAACRTLYANWNTHWNNVKTTLNTAVNTLRTYLTTLYNNANTYFNNLRNACTNLLNNWRTHWTNTQTTLNTAVNTLRTYLTNLYNNANTQFNNLKTACSTLLSNWKTHWTNVLNYANTKKTEIVNKVKGIATDVQNLAGYFWNAGAAILNSLKASVTEGFTRVINTAKEKLKTLKSYLPNSPAKEGPFRELPYWGDVIPGPIEDALKATDPLVSKLSNTLGKLRSPLDNLRDPTASINGGLSNISNVTNNSNSSSNVTYEIHMENHLSNDVDMTKFVREFQKIIKLQGQQGGYF